MLCRDHSAAIIDCTFCQRVSRIERSLCFHVDNKANHILLCCIIRCGRSNRIKANIITHRSLRQRRILIVASRYYFRSLRRSVCIINVNTNRANLWGSLDILLSNFVYRTFPVFLYAALHDLRQDLLVGQQLFGRLIIVRIKLCLCYRVGKLIFCHVLFFHRRSLPPSRFNKRILTLIVLSSYHKLLLISSCATISKPLNSYVHLSIMQR